MTIPNTLTRLVGHMQRKQKLQYEPYHLFLSQAAIEQASHKGFLALAQLIQAQYFSVILTTNSNGMLEHGLESVGLELSVLSTDEHTDEQIIQALEDPASKVCIIKLPQVCEDKTTTMTPPSPALSTAIERYLNHDLIVVGPVTPNCRLVEMIQPAELSSTYYCTHEQPSSDDSIVQLLQIKDAPKDYFLICGEYGHFDTFFKTIISRTHPKETRPQKRKDARRRHKKRAIADSHKTIGQKADILLVTVTEIEAQVLLNCFPSPDKHTIDQVYYDLGYIGPARTVMVRSTHMGPFPAMRCVDEGIAQFSPRTVIMVGIAFGLHPNEQKIGDILVATQIINWDSQKIRTGPDNEPVIVLRGTGMRVADRLLTRFQASQLEWRPPPHIHFGPILSSSRLIDHEGTRDELLHYFPEAIGGEMEGHGLCDACSRKKVDWILVKAICDWADGNKGENKEAHQRMAAGNAARFVLSVIQQYGLL